MNAVISTSRTTFLTLELLRPGRPVEGTLGTAAWGLIIDEAARCGIRQVRIVGGSRLGGEVEELSAHAVSEGLSVVSAETDSFGRCGDGYAAVLSDGGVSRCLRSQPVAGNVRERPLGEILAGEAWLRAAGSPCPACGRAGEAPEPFIGMRGSSVRPEREPAEADAEPPHS
jgi:hypothetical protein